MHCFTNVAATLSDLIVYRIIGESSVYLFITRQDIIYVIYIVSQFVSTPTTSIGKLCFIFFNILAGNGVKVCYFTQCFL